MATRTEDVIAELLALAWYAKHKANTCHATDSQRGVYGYFYETVLALEALPQVTLNVDPNGGYYADMDLICHSLKAATEAVSKTYTIRSAAKGRRGDK